MTTVSASRSGGVALAVGGGVLLAHPLYLDHLLVYPGADWSFVPLFHALFTALGTVSIAGGIPVARNEPLERPAWIGIGLLTLVFVPLYGVVIAHTGSVDPAFPGTFARRSFVAGLVGGAFVAGGGIAAADPLRTGVGPTLPAIPFVPVVAEWRSGAPLEPILEIHFLLTGAPLGGSSHLGIIVLVAAVVVGIAVEVLGPTDAGGRSRSWA